MSNPSRGTPQRGRGFYRGGTPHRGTYTPRGGTPFHPSTPHTPSNSNQTAPSSADIPGEPWGSVTESSILDLIRSLEIEWQDSRSTLWAETARAVQGWADDGQHTPRDRWHEGYDRHAGDRRLTRLRLMALIRDLIAALDRVCGVGTIVAHVHGELNPNLRLEAITAGMMANNVSLTVSDILQGNKAFQGIVEAIMQAVRDRLAPMFGRDWRQRAVASRYIDPQRMRVDPVVQDFPPSPQHTPSPTQSPPCTPSPTPTRRSPSPPSRTPSPDTPFPPFSLPGSPPPPFTSSYAPSDKGKGKSATQPTSSSPTPHRSSIDGLRPSSVSSFLSGLSSAPSSISWGSVPFDMSPPSSPVPARASTPAASASLPSQTAGPSRTAPPRSEPDQDVFSTYGYTSLPPDVIDLLQMLQASDVVITRVEEIYNDVGRARQLDELMAIGFNLGTARAFVRAMRG
ncbi:hypothetical protein OF83DRAFT_1180197 [Amylostereum chailletii]|nr:hypothetical protein OF83DRAFT_1180197 [Amylostereum chailletii]